MSIKKLELVNKKTEQPKVTSAMAMDAQSPQAALVGGLDNSHATVQAHAALLDNQQIPTVQRQTFAQRISKTGGNRYIQRVMDQVQRQALPQSTIALQATSASTDNLPDDFKAALEAWMVEADTQIGNPPVHEPSIESYKSPPTRELPFEMAALFYGSQLENIVKDFASRLWQAGKEKVKQAANSAVGPTNLDDDMWLYNTRNQMITILKAWYPQPMLQSVIGLDKLEQIFEQSSRGVLDERGGFTGKKDVKKILISGFDPFGSGGGPKKPNPSGAAALALDGETLQVTVDGKLVEAEIQSLVFPVRWKDFDDGIVKDFLGAFVQQHSEIDMILGIGQGDTSYQIEEEASRSRLNIPDNVGETGDRKYIGTEHLKENTLPPEVKKGLKDDLGVGENTNHLIERGDSFDNDSNANEDYGTAGGFLCNELMYRSLDYVEGESRSIPVGFLHVPDPNSSTATIKTTEIITEVREILKKSIETLP